MKKQICAILAAAMMLSAFTGCQKRQDSSPASETIPTSAEDTAEHSGTLLADFPVPERFTGDWTGVEGCVTVHADAAISLPEVDTIPTATVKRHFFTQEDADKLREVFTGDSPFYEETIVTKQSLQKRLEVYYDMERGVIPIQLDGGNTKEVLEGYIERTKAAIEEAPDESDRIPRDFILQKESDSPERDELSGWSEADGRKIHYSIHNMRNFGIGTSATVYLDGYGNNNYCCSYELEEVPDMLTSMEPAISEKEAIAMGDALLERLGVLDMVCDQINAVNYYTVDYLLSYYTDNSIANNSIEEIHDAGYKMRYVRSVGGVPVIYTENSGSASPVGESGLQTWGYEYMEIYVNKDGVVYFSWGNPYTQPEIDTTAAELLPFSDIQDIFAKMIMVTSEDLLAINIKNGFEVHESKDVHDITLRLMRIRDKDNVTEGRLIPVWDFWALDKAHAVDRSYSKYVYEDGYERIVLTINALDGTIIDRDMGY